jgi:3-phenylpropionate/trans-cinnamate dioxygenase ferredoxin subunit
MEDNVWVPTLDESELHEDTMHLVFPKGVSIILIKKAERVYALRNRCAHMSCTLAGGRLEGYTLQCPCHEWKFDITTGEFLEPREITVHIPVSSKMEGIGERRNDESVSMYAQHCLVPEDEEVFHRPQHPVG